jgi:hypothetical protein
MVPGSRERNGVVLVSYPGDEHGTALEHELAGRGYPVVRASIAVATLVPVTWELSGQLTFDGMSIGSQRWTGVWRRPGQPQLQHILPSHLDFAESETRDAFRGSLLARAIRWLNEPSALWRAEHKLVQLEVAHSVGARVPRTIVTNDALAARRFVSTCTSVVAKPVRYGLVATDPQPLVTWTTTVECDEEFEFLGVPVLLQDQIMGRDHFRIVTVGPDMFTTKLRTEVLDWRTLPIQDQTWEACSASDVPPEITSLAGRIAARLGLAFTSQDWIVDENGRAHFLEANPNGQWLFADEPLSGAITRALGDWLTAADR